VGAGRVQRHGGANERLPRLFIDLVTLMEIDGTAGVAFEAGVEVVRGILQRGAFCEGHLHDSLVRLAGANDSGVRPNRNPTPLSLLDDPGVCLLDERSDPSERLAPPVTLLPNFLVNHLRWGHFSLGRAHCVRSCAPARHPLRHLVAYGSANKYRAQ
jgi:hypothetical protein